MDVVRGRRAEASCPSPQRHASSQLHREAQNRTTFRRSYGRRSRNCVTVTGEGAAVLGEVWPAGLSGGGLTSHKVLVKMVRRSKCSLYVSNSDLKLGGEGVRLERDAGVTIGEG